MRAPPPNPARLDCDCEINRFGERSLLYPSALPPVLSAVAFGWSARWFATTTEQIAVCPTSPSFPNRIDKCLFVDGQSCRVMNQAVRDNGLAKLISHTHTRTQTPSPQQALLLRRSIRPLAQDRKARGVSYVCILGRTDPETAGQCFERAMRVYATQTCILTLLTGLLLLPPPHLTPCYYPHPTMQAGSGYAGRILLADARVAAAATAA